VKLFDPDNVTRLTVINDLLKPQQVYTMLVNFELPSGEDWIQISKDKTEVFFFYNDIDAKAGNGFLGRYIPANLEFDQFELDLRIEVKNSTKEFRLLTNGNLSTMNRFSWRITFPPYFNSSAPFVHLTSVPYFLETKRLSSRKGKIPVTIYGDDRAAVGQGLKKIEALLKKSHTNG
jgi:hypothetical protein